MDFQKYIVEQALVIVPVLWVIGVFLKRTPRVPNWKIAWILVVLGIILTVGILGFSAQAVVQGVLVAGVAVLGHQLLKQTINKDIN